MYGLFACVNLLIELRNGGLLLAEMAVGHGEVVDRGNEPGVAALAQKQAGEGGQVTYLSLSSLHQQYAQHLPLARGLGREVGVDALHLCLNVAGRFKAEGVRGVDKGVIEVGGPLVRGNDAVKTV